MRSRTSLWHSVSIDRSVRWTLLNLELRHARECQVRTVVQLNQHSHSHSHPYTYHTISNPLTSATIMTTGTHKPATQTQALLFHTHRELLSVLPHNLHHHQHRHGDEPLTLMRLPAQSRFSTLPASRRPVPLTTKRHLHLISISFPSSIQQLASPRPPPQRPIAHDSPGPERWHCTLIHLADPGPLPTKENQNQNRSLKNAACTSFGSWSCARSGSDRSGQVRSGVDGRT